jgi:hypothetical protein
MTHVSAPYVAPWQGEHPSGLPILSTSRGITYGDAELPGDRIGGYLIERWAGTRTGEVAYGDHHPARQAACITTASCCVCAGPSARDDGALLYLLGGVVPSGRLPTMVRTTNPPVCRPCTKKTLRHCPPVQRDGMTAVWATSTAVLGAVGTLHLPSGPVREDIELLLEDRRSQWLLAEQLQVQLTGLRIAELPLAEQEAVP